VTAAEQARPAFLSRNPLRRPKLPRSPRASRTVAPESFWQTSGRLRSSGRRPRTKLTQIGERYYSISVATQTGSPAARRCRAARSSLIRVRFRHSSGDGRGDLKDGTVRKQEGDVSTRWGVASTTRQICATSEAANSALLTPFAWKLPQLCCEVTPCLKAKCAEGHVSTGRCPVALFPPSTAREDGPASPLSPASMIESTTSKGMPRRSGSSPASNRSILLSQWSNHAALELWAERRAVERTQFLPRKMQTSS